MIHIYSHIFVCQRKFFWASHEILKCYFTSHRAGKRSDWQFRAGKRSGEMMGDEDDLLDEDERQ